LSVEPQVLLERVERHGDLFAALLGLTQTLPDLRGREAGDSSASKVGRT
jgi:hypothetical protein